MTSSKRAVTDRIRKCSLNEGGGRLRQVKPMVFEGGVLDTGHQVGRACQIASGARFPAGRPETASSSAPTRSPPSSPPCAHLLAICRCTRNF